MYLYRRIRLVNVSGWSPAKYVFFPEAYSKPSQTSKMKLFAKIGNHFKSLFILGKRSISDVWQDPSHFFFRSKKKIGGKRKKRKSFKAKTIKRLSPRSKCYYFSHSRVSRIQKFWLADIPSQCSMAPPL